MLEKGRRPNNDGNSSEVEAVRSTVEGVGGSGSAKGKKRGKKEKAMEKEKERQEIEKSWDVPGREAPPALAPATSQPARGPTLPPPIGLEACVDGVPARSHTPTPPITASGIQKGKGTVNNSREINRNAACESIIAAVSSSSSAKKLPAAVERNEFVREVLTLIHTDKNFVDGLWRDYIARLHMVD